MFALHFRCGSPHSLPQVPSPQGSARLRRYPQPSRGPGGGQGQPRFRSPERRPVSSRPQTCVPQFKEVLCRFRGYSPPSHLVCLFRNSAPVFLSIILTVMQNCISREKQPTLNFQFPSSWNVPSSLFEASNWSFSRTSSFLR